MKDYFNTTNLKENCFKPHPMETDFRGHTFTNGIKEK